ncbi:MULTISPECIES: hypothetical protein [Cryobacterium]|uniref:hypothetical protein n=1 Tax=Cryobacterium TaxID=69578 RepID=UPI00106DBDD5|nr:MULTISPECIES: hypothetical protein [Cryobacterium]TFD49314.1 hypothetical protein E3T33_00180 [Cryobacterium sp. TMT1-2-1]TFD90918.1 hypothetical protein E3T56_00510 [Cryobacterium psychrotolerans]
MASADWAENPHDEWMRVLDDLERFLGSFGDGLDATPWTAPVRLGPLPPALVGRAHKVLAGQRELVREIEAAQQAAGRHLAAVRAVSAARSAETSVYVDVMS